MRLKQRILIALALSLLSSFAVAENQVLEELFDQSGVEGTLIIESLQTTERFVHNVDRAQQRFSPASTFKIPNSLIALEQLSYEPDSLSFAWDGKQHWLEAWNQSHSLSSAFKASCVWCYQSIARQLEKDDYRQILEALNYGNATIGDRIDLFWLDGSLQISAAEQIRFLRKLVRQNLLFKKTHQKQVMDMMLDSTNEKYTLFGKTGWAASDLNVGWYVGFLKASDSQIWLFSMNMRMDSIDQAPLRRQVVLDAFKQLGLTRN